ncbi:MAG: hypothetical protein ACK5MZ_05400 [Aestuariibaculum sp.]
MTTKIIWFVLGMGISMLILSGVWITLKRKKSKQKKNHIKVMGIWRFVNWFISIAIIGFMFGSIIAKYQSSVKVIAIISLGLVFFIVLGYYIFVYRLNKIVTR